jgi:RNA polymerase sigma-70 factor (ECF subfamily)
MKGRDVAQGGRRMTGDGGAGAARERFEALYLEHYQSVFRYVHRRAMAGPEDFDDLVADIFAVAWRRLDQVPGAPEDRLWLFGVARRRLLEHHRRHRSRTRLLHRLAAQPIPDDPAPVSIDPAHRRVRHALMTLRPRDREVLLLIAWDGLTHAEAAAVLDCSVNAIALRLRRARGRLRRVLDPAPPTSDPSATAAATPGLPATVKETR